jgi:hypothetical protein
LPDTTSTNGWNEREFAYVGPGRAQFEARLEASLRSVVTRPIQPYHESFSRQNVLCPVSAEMADPSQIEHHEDWWATVTDRQLQIARKTVAKRVATAFGLSLERDVEMRARAVQDVHDWASHFGNGGRGIVYSELWVRRRRDHELSIA